MWSIHHFGSDENMSTINVLTAMKLGTDINVALRMKPNDNGDHLTFPLAPPAGQTFHLSCEIC